MKVKLYDALNYLIHETDIEEPLPKVLVWGSRAFAKSGNRRYGEVSLTIINDTDDQGFEVKSG